jgi:hypothetical protein
MENKEQPAMPHTPTRPWDNESANGFSGLTKREYFAGLAMNGLLSQEHQPSFAHLAEASVMAADALLR